MLQPKSTPDYSVDIAGALAMPSGHLSIGRGGFTLHYRNGAMLSGYGCEAIKAQCIAAGLPVTDSRCVPFDVVVQLTLVGPLVAVGREPALAPWHGLFYRRCTWSLRDTLPPAQRSGTSPVETMPAPAEGRTAS